jgi:hypothetical protein
MRIVATDLAKAAIYTEYAMRYTRMYTVPA